MIDWLILIGMKSCCGVSASASSASQIVWHRPTVLLLQQQSPSPVLLLLCFIITSIYTGHLEVGCCCCYISMALSCYFLIMPLHDCSLLRRLLLLLLMLLRWAWAVGW